MHSLDRPALYRITVAGHLGSRWRDWFHHLTITHETDSGGVAVTVLTGFISDQAALRGTLGQIWDLGLVLLSVMREGATPESGCACSKSDTREEP